MSAKAYLHCRTRTQDSGYCKMQIFLIGSDSDLDTLIEIY